MDKSDLFQCGTLTDMEEAVDIAFDIVESFQPFFTDLARPSSSFEKIHSDRIDQRRRSRDDRSTRTMWYRGRDSAS